jgi:hypothetical protein
LPTECPATRRTAFAASSTAVDYRPAPKSSPTTLILAGPVDTTGRPVLEA